MKLWSATLVLAALLLSACGPATPEEARIDNIEDMAEAEAREIESGFGNQIAAMRGEADTAAAQAEAANSFDAERLKTRAEALREEARILERQSEARVKAVRDRAQAEVSTIKAE
ncbi:hypothetical protein [Sphingomonas sp. M1-B02]|uniref:hypothetical protein n=1 Tax=Sphingomonas sp. M1-B02 TaxID=3114300 RepID=UPI00223F8B85|nr:hypothetical protein [Sphingomonas sp. S6-11]UZK65618.1 hypothetical protein OKW87_14025 [Sphingomonas sp. S6-11]